MKNNQEKLTDAFGMLREDTLQACVGDPPVPYRTANCGVARRRVAVLLAACLTFALLTTALLVLPFLRAEDPAVPTTDTAEAPPAAELSWYDAPLVHVQVLALEKDDVENHADELTMTENQDISVVKGNRLVDQQVYVLFRLEEGETLTATSRNMAIAHTTLNAPDIYPIYESMTWEERFLHFFSIHWFNVGIAGPSIEIDSSEAFLTWGGNRYYAENPLVMTPDEDFIDFVLRDSEGRITGAGSVYLGNRKLVENTESRYYDAVSISRGKVLGSVRFDNPDAVTEEQVEAFLESLHEQAEDLRKTLFDDPTMSECFNIALADLINTHYSHLDNFAMSWSSSLYDNYIRLTIYEEVEDRQISTDYLLMEDGTWGEIDRKISFCEYCGVQVAACSHYQIEHIRYLLTDGRVMDVHNGIINNHGARTLVKVTDTTYKPCTEHDLIVALMTKDCPMVEPVYQAYMAIKSELGEETYAFDISRFIRFRSGAIQWNRYTVLEVRVGDGGDFHTYFVLENGDYAELDSIRYGCSACDYTTPSEASIEAHGHGNTAMVYILKNGGRYTVQDGMIDRVAHEPVYTP